MNARDILVGAVKAIQSVGMPATDQSKMRLSVCKICEYRSGARCGLCGCIVEAKVKHTNEKCPAGKW